jgi:hypothetical protein
MWIMHLLKTTCTKESQNFQDLGAIHIDNMLRDMWFMVNMQLI